MKKMLWIIPVFILLFVGLMTAIGFALPKEYSVERSVQIKATPAEVYALISDLEKWPDWVYWNEDNVAELEITLGDTTQGEGASQSWSEKHGTGTMTFTKCVQDEQVTMAMQFADFPEMVATITLTPETIEETVPETDEVTSYDVTVVTWAANGALGNDPMSAWFGLMLRPMVGRDYDYGLAHLKDLLEKPDKPPEEADDPAQQGSSDTDDASGDDALGDDASGDDASGDDASGDDASGDDASGDDASTDAPQPGDNTDNGDSGSAGDGPDGNGPDGNGPDGNSSAGDRSEDGDSNQDNNS